VQGTWAKVWDELDEPLGFARDCASASSVDRKRPMRGAAFAATVLAIAATLVILLRHDVPVTGEPFAVARVEVLPAPRKRDAPDVTASVRETAPSPTASTQLESSGVKVIRGGGGPSKPLIIDVARELAARPASAGP